MKNKFFDSTLNINSSPERNQKPTQKGEIKLLDVVALTQDVPEHNLKRGAIGMVVEILSNGEAYKVEFSKVYGHPHHIRLFCPNTPRIEKHQPPNRYQNS